MIRSFFIGVAASFIMIQLLFLGSLSYLYGSVYKTSTRASNLNILMVDYDLGVVGQSLRMAIEMLSSPKFPTIIEGNQPQQDVIKAVYKAEYWGAIIVNPYASQNIAESLVGTLHNSTAITYIYNEARYPTVEAGYIVANMQQLIAATRLTYMKINGSHLLQHVNRTSETALQTLFNPITATPINLKPTPQGTKVLYNTVSLVMPIVMQFFFLMAVNGISGQFSIYSHLPLKNNGFIRLVLSTLYTFIGALCTTGYEHAFQESDWLSTRQFMLVWMTYWLYMHINFLLIDCATAFIPMSFIPFFFFLWVIFNMASVVNPFELSPGFYRWGYALPAHETLDVLITVWSGGSQNLYRALPILFSWEVILVPLSIFALHYRCANAAKQYERNEEAMQNKYGQQPELKATSDVNTLQEIDHDATLSKQSATIGNEYFPSTPAPFQNTLERITSSRAH